ncbi:hypothetical protein [Methylocapsa sp. S129]|uniref:hypothetical protein n=1 Tax=Methylocapsa sp. S129 TaxID=1641869 RepID=UPI00131D0B2D|nr:hypothetical protein [Methylocapsa sp. S129]
MRNILVFGAAVVALTFGASSVYANGPLFSPYEVLTFHPAEQAQPAEIPEGRAAYTGGERGCYPARVRIHHVWRNVQVCE